MRIKINILFTFLVVILFCMAPETGNAVHSKIWKTAIENESSNHKTTFNKKELEKQLGRKLTLKERLLLPIAKKQMKKKAKAGKSKIGKERGGKSQIVALLLCIFLGILGVHRFYLGYTGMGVLYILTLGLFGIGWLIDLILLIIPNGLTPKGRTRY